MELPGSAAQPPKHPLMLTEDQACDVIAWVMSHGGRDWTAKEARLLAGGSESLTFMWLRSAEAVIANSFQSR